MLREPAFMERILGWANPIYYIPIDQQASRGYLPGTRECSIERRSPRS